MKHEDKFRNLRELTYTDDPALLRLAVKQLVEDRKLKITAIVDLIFEDCYSEKEFQGMAEIWQPVINPEWSVQDLRDWAMKRRKLKS